MSANITITDAGYTIAFICVLLSLMSSLVRRATIDPKKLKESREKMKEHQKQMQEHQKKGNTEAMLKAQEQMTKHMMDQMKQQFKPMLITYIPFILIFGWLNSQYGNVGDVVNLFGNGLSWFWWYLLVSLVSSLAINKVVETVW